MSYIKNEYSLLWLAKETDSNIIGQAKIAVTDVSVLKDLISELRNINSYVHIGTHFFTGKNENKTIYTDDGAEKYETLGETKEHNEAFFCSYYKNPRSEVFRLMTEKFGLEKNLFDLFSTLARCDRIEQKQKEFQIANKIIAELETKSIDSSISKAIIKQMWPNFGFFATEVLNCTTIEYVKEYNLEEFQSIFEVSKKIGRNLQEEELNVLTNAGLAQGNAKVLTLARKANKISNN